MPKRDREPLRAALLLASPIAHAEQYCEPQSGWQNVKPGGTITLQCERDGTVTVYLVEHPTGTAHGTVPDVQQISGLGLGQGIDVRGYANWHILPPGIHPSPANTPGGQPFAVGWETTPERAKAEGEPRRR